MRSSLDFRDLAIVCLFLACAVLGVDSCYSSREARDLSDRMDTVNQWIIGIRSDVEALEAVDGMRGQLQEIAIVTKALARHHELELGADAGE